MPDNPVFMNYMGYAGDIDPAIAEMMPVTNWANNGAAFADEEDEDE